MPEKRCISCMRKMGEGETVCPHCGYDPAKDKPPPPDALPPESLLNGGKYAVGRVLGRGGFGITYVALEQNLGLRVAVKECLPLRDAQRGADGVSVQWHERDNPKERFLREARAMAQIYGIPGVVPVREHFEDNNTAYIVMDYVEGETLADRLKRAGPMSAKECFDLLSPAMDALAQAHGSGLVHRDIKPSNIMIERTKGGAERPWLLDFGAAKGTDGESFALNNTQMFVSRPYSPPEQYEQGGKIGAWTDVYAMSATFLHCITGKTPPQSTTRAMKDPVPELLRPAPGRVGEVLMKGLAQNPEERYRSMEELRDALEKALHPVSSAWDDDKTILPAQRGEDIRIPLTLRFEEVAAGGRKDITIERNETCDVCQGGGLVSRNLCPKCRGAGMVLRSRRIQFQIPVKGKTGDVLRMGGAGHAGRNGGEAGDVFISLSVLPREPSRQESTSAPPPRPEPAPPPRPETPPPPQRETRPSPQAQKEIKPSEEVQGELESAQNKKPLKKARIIGELFLIAIAVAMCAYGSLFVTPQGKVLRLYFESANGKCGVDASWTLDKDGFLEISGTGEMWDINYKYPTPWNDYRKVISRVAITHGITYIGSYSFSDCAKLKEVDIPDSVTGIGEYAFSECSSLTNIDIPDSVTEIKAGAFSDCSSLTSVFIPDSVRVIGYSAFGDCSNLSSVSIGPYTVFEKSVLVGTFDEHTAVTVR